MKKLFTLALLCLCLAGCNFREKGSLRPTEFEAVVSDVTGTRAHIRITPQDDHAWYSYAIFYQTDHEFSMPDEKLAERLIAKGNEIFDEFTANPDYSVTRFSDIFCFQGDREFAVDFLDPDTKYRMFIFQVDPFEKIHIGGTLSVYFSTTPIDYSDLTFDVSFSSDVLRIEPSDPDAIYIWEYESLSRVNEAFGIDFQFFGRLVYMYQDYDFIDNLVTRGPVEWEFSKEDPGIKEGVEYSLMIAGYDGDNINTPLSIIHFIYRKGNIEVTYSDL